MQGKVSIVLPVVNMGKTNVTNAVVTPVLSTDTATWPFEITQSSYSQNIADLPGTDTGMSDMDRRRELTWNLKTRSDVGNGYQKISFNVRYFASDGSARRPPLILTSRPLVQPVSARMENHLCRG